MRGAGLVGFVLWLGLSAGCGGSAPEKRAPVEEKPEWPLDGFLALAPEGASWIGRLPRTATLEDKSAEITALLRTADWGDDPYRAWFGLTPLEGMDADRAAGVAVTGKGARVRYYPTGDAATLNRSLQPLLNANQLRESGRWTLVESTTTGNPQPQSEPMPRGDLALRIHQHPALAMFARPGDVLDLGFDLRESGFEWHGRLRAGPRTENTDDAISRAQPGYGGMLNRLPGWLAFRMETTAPPTALAATIARRFAVHTGIREEGDRAQVVRLLREALSGADADEGFAFGVEFRAGQATCVVTGALGKDRSPILARMARDDRSSFGPMVFDTRDMGPKRKGETRDGWALWLVDPEAKVDGLPEVFWPLVGAACEGEDGPGLTIAYFESEGSFACAVGPRADLLVRSVAKRWRNPVEEPGTEQLWHVRQRASDPGRTGPAPAYVAGLVVCRAGLEELGTADQAMLKKLFGLGPDAKWPETIAMAAFRDGHDLRLFGRTVY